ncbi:hypothetical protein HGRIS_008267 [Hohenbuehelia grisea]|uniref:Uncharacterized protein n=1 Tax=Hohenbuehelia grisea TaxID=104357 RepID=A0ABR3J7W6_9AGAR
MPRRSLASNAYIHLAYSYPHTTGLKTRKMETPGMIHSESALEALLRLSPPSPTLSMSGFSSFPPTGEIPIMLCSDSCLSLVGYDFVYSSTESTATISNLQSDSSIVTLHREIAIADNEAPQDSVSPSVSVPGGYQQTASHNSRRSRRISDWDAGYTGISNMTFGEVDEDEISVTGGTRPCSLASPFRLQTIEDPRVYTSWLPDGEEDDAVPGNEVATGSSTTTPSSSRILPYCDSTGANPQQSASSTHLNDRRDSTDPRDDLEDSPCVRKSSTRRRYGFVRPKQIPSSDTQDTLLDARFGSATSATSSSTLLDLLVESHHEPSDGDDPITSMDISAQEHSPLWTRLSASESLGEMDNAPPLVPFNPESLITVEPRELLDPANTGAIPARQAFPEHQTWLKDIVLELLIDQEGFRNVKASFKLSGYSVQEQPLGADVYGVAEFMPVKRQRFNFHYAPFDGSPKLRRLMVNGNESRDYISREGCLDIKDNGVYTVRGIESPNFTFCGDGTSSSPIDPGKLMWKFDYLVGDKIFKKSGRIPDGEKTITPLTFSCSALLLHPAQGRKIHFIQMFLKNISPSLKPEKLDLLQARTGSPGSPSKKSVDQPAVGAGQAHFARKSVAWGRHQRSRSHTPSERQARADNQVPRTPSKLRDSLVALPSDQIRRRRRASSAGEQSWNPDHSNPVVYLPQFPQPTEARVPICSPRHIVPRAQLTEMLELASSQNDADITPMITPLPPYKAKQTSTRSREEPH